MKAAVVSEPASTSDSEGSTPPAGCGLGPLVPHWILAGKSPQFRALWTFLERLTIRLTSPEWWL